MASKDELIMIIGEQEVEIYDLKKELKNMTRRYLECSSAGDAPPGSSSNPQVEPDNHAPPGFDPNDNPGPPGSGKRLRSRSRNGR